MKRLTKEELISLVSKIVNCEGTEKEIEEIVDIALAYKPIQLKKELEI